MEQETQQKEIEELRWIDSLSELLDNRFRIPGTSIRFGVDFLIGLIPYAGDLISFAISGLLVIAMARKGASSLLVGKMLGNIFLDTTVGSIPILGDLFDLGYRANKRNVNLLKEHYYEGDHRGSVWPVVFGVLIALIVLAFVMVYLMFELIQWLIGLI